MPSLRRTVLVVGALTLGLALGFGVPAGARTSDGASPVEQLVASCPSADEIAAIDAKMRITIEGDPTEGTSVCGMTRLRERAYQSLRVMRALRFSKPLPWTSLSLWDWFTGAIKGIRFRGDITNSFCCEPADTIDIQDRNLAALQVGSRFMSPTDPVGLDSLIMLFAHEARHNEAKPHTCGPNDSVYADLLSDGICAREPADISARLTPSAASVRSGDTLTLVATISNSGPGGSRYDYYGADVPAGTELAALAASQGQCTVLPSARISCDLGPLAAGASATITATLHVTATSGRITFPAGSRGARVVGFTVDPDYFNNWATLDIPVASTPTTTPTTTQPPPAVTTTPAATTPKPGPKQKQLPKCKRGHRSTKKHPCRK